MDWGKKFSLNPSALSVTSALVTHRVVKLKTLVKKAGGFSSEVIISELLLHIDRIKAEGRGGEEEEMRGVKMCCGQEPKDSNQRKQYTS